MNQCVLRELDGLPRGYLMSAEHITVPIAYVKTLLSEVEHRGYSPRQLLEDLDICPDDLEHFNFPALRYGLLFQRAMRVLQDEWFGLLSGGRIHAGSFRMLTLFAIHCSSMRQAIKRSQEFCRICRGFKISGELIEGERSSTVCLAPLNFTSEEEFDRLLREVKPVNIHTTLAAWHHFYSWLVGVNVPLKRVYFTFSEDELVEEMAQLSAEQVAFDQEFNGFEFASEYLQYPVVRTEGDLDEFLRLAPFNLFVSQEQSKALAPRVKNLLAQHVGDSALGAEQVATRLNMSSTKMRRSLQGEGTSFQKLKDECRMEAAFHYLSCPELSNREVAEKLGFDETSAFFRAFKKWTGVTPGQYRAEKIQSIRLGN